MAFKNSARSLRNQEYWSEEDTTSSRSEELPLINIFHEPTEDETDNADDNDKQTVPTSTSYFEISEFKQPSANKQNGVSDDIEEEPKLAPKDLLLWSIENNKFEMFSSLLETPEVDPKFKYGKRHLTKCMERACRKEWGGKFVKTLLEHGVKPNVHEILLGPIHYAAKYGNPEALEALLQNKKTKINAVDSSGRTALHHAVKYSQKGREAEYDRCIELLLKRPDLGVNIPNNSGYTAVHEAANLRKNAVALILKHRKDYVDLDSYRTKGRTARECIHSNYPELRPLLQKYQTKYQSSDRHSQLLSALQNRQEDIFRDILCQVDEDGKARVDPNYCYERLRSATCLEVACREKDCVQYVKELLRAGADPNFVNPDTNQTALQVAVEMQNIPALTLLLKDSRMNINPFYDKVTKMVDTLDQQTRRKEAMQDDKETKQYKDALQELKCILDTRTSEIQSTLSPYMNMDRKELFQHLYCENYEDFEKNFPKAFKDIDDGHNTLLQHATRRRLEKFVRLLLKNGADPNATTEREKRPPILIACMDNDPKIMKVLLSSETDNKLDVNVTDTKGNTPLHYVSNTEHLDCVVNLMRCGADLKHKNIFDKSPLPANSVKKFLDMSLDTNKTSPGRDEYEIIFDYNFLLAHKEKGTESNIPPEGDQPLTSDQESGSRNVHLHEKLNPEMDFLFYISQSNEHRKVINHPIITSFLHMKWQRLNLYFYINIFLYLTFAILLSTYIGLKIGYSATNGSESGITSNDTKPTQSIMMSCGLNAAWTVILMFLVYFTVKELLQLSLSPKFYFTNYENILDLTIIFFSGYILFCSKWEDTLVAITITLSWTKLILLAGRLPKLSTKVEMLKTIAMFLLNFLTGLAVSDTLAIKSNAEELSLVSRIRLIYEMESTLLQWHAFVEKWRKFTFRCPFIQSQNSKIKNISLFPDTSYKKVIYILPNKGPNIVFDRNGLSKGEDGKELDSVCVEPASEGSGAQLIPNNHANSKRQITSCKMSLVIIGEATHIISKRSEPDINVMKENFSEIHVALKENESKWSNMENKMENMLQLLENCQHKLDALERK